MRGITLICNLYTLYGSFFGSYITKALNFVFLVVNKLKNISVLICASVAIKLTI